MLKLTRRRIYFINDIPFSVTSFCAFSTEARKEKSEGVVHMRRWIFQGDPLKSVKRPFRVWCATYPPTMSHGRETPAINTSAKYLSMSQIRCQPQTFPLLVSQLNLPCTEHCQPLPHAHTPVSSKRPLPQLLLVNKYVLIIHRGDSRHCL